MPYQVMPLVAPIKGTRYNIGGTLIDDQEMPESSNCYITRNTAVGKKAGYTTLGTGLPLTGIVLGTDQFFQTNGNDFLIALTTTDAYYLLLGAWTEITPAADFTGGPTNLWSMEIMNDLHIITNSVDPVYKWNGTGLYVALGGSPPKCAYLKKYHDYLVMAYVIDGGNIYPQRIQWCDTGLPEVWTIDPTTNAGYVDLNDGVDFIVGMEILGDRLIVIKERSIYSGYLTGTSSVFQFDLMVNGVGAKSGATISNIKNDLIFLGNDNVYLFNGLTVEEIGDQIKDQLFAISNPAKIQYSHSLVVEELDEYRLYIPTGSSDYPTAEFRYNYSKKAWLPGTCQNITRAGYYVKQTGNTWDSTVGTWDAQTSQWNDRIYLANSPINVLGDSGGYVYQEDYSISSANGTAIDAYFETKDLAMKDWNDTKFWARLDVIGQGTSSDVSYSTDEGNSWVSIGTVYFGTSSTPQKLDFRVTSFRIRFKFDNPRAELFEVRQMTVYYDKAGRL